jgi:predicted RNA-binding protein with PUA-like domain
MTASRSRQYWLVKSEPEVFSFDDLLASPDRTTCWDGVRNYQARNTIRDGMRRGDLVLFYHSNADPDDPHFDPKSKGEAPTWLMVDLKAVEPLAHPVSLGALRGIKGLEKMALLQKGSRLSVQPVTAKEWEIVMRLGRG